MGTNEIQGGVIITNSSFSSCNVTGVVKARQVSECEITGCRYDFYTTNKIIGESPFYINKTDISLNETKLNITAEDNTVIITLIDVNANNPIAGVEVAIINNNLVFAYRDTDGNGQIVLDNLLGTYNFEFSYPGDPYAYLPTSINKTFTFVKNETPKENTTTKTDSNTKTPTTKKVTKTASKIIAKKTTFKKSKKVKKYKITLKNTKNKAIGKVRVYLKVKGKTYKATTNFKGVATFKIAKLTKKGKYTAVIKFAGNKNYKASKAKVKITVKK
jgi:hypothetical protein